ncbi:hypothetical protein N7510_000775 [Penicillium lagena]|uniref:uncharacterized protein n=1 Tax=Penicillium lagena TaxID=94218 RepID=UPI00253FDE07|nr:uncharacterized protein N7510_000775 [Penicillium lagena]KAJ5624466.1 hypothetical protein N7510_000775 [Penicillium lagena]
MALTQQFSNRQGFLVLALYLITSSCAAFILPKVPDIPTVPDIPPTIPESIPPTIPDIRPEPEEPITHGGSDSPPVDVDDPSSIPNTGSSGAPGGTDHTPLFADKEALEKYFKLFDGVTDLLNIIESATSTTAATFTRPAGIPTVPVNAVITPEPTAADPTLGCSIFTSYMSLCAPTTSAMGSSSVLGVQATDRAFASCACYSSTYWVPDALDSAARACAGYTTATVSDNPVGGLAAAATTASRMEGFCQSMDNVRHYASAQFGAVTPTASASSSLQWKWSWGGAG